MKNKREQEHKKSSEPDGRVVHSGTWPPQNQDPLLQRPCKVLARTQSHAGSARSTDWQQQVPYSGRGRSCKTNGRRGRSTITKIKLYTYVHMKESARTPCTLAARAVQWHAGLPAGVPAGLEQHSLRRRRRKARKKKN